MFFDTNFRVGGNVGLAPIYEVILNTEILGLL
jgi:hypothetical protein